MNPLEDHIAYCATTLDDIPIMTRSMSLLMHYERENGKGSATKLFKEIMETTIKYKIEDLFNT